ncbi:MAG: hypothetical protein DRO11_02125 [Methanobacteriota archaeon]|nr:MAG: hypothetical protein DRO11_02125 [Euryarchaeota archaeon]
MTIGQSYTINDDYIKWAVYGGEGTGKTHFALAATRLRKDKKVLVFNLEPKSNLYSVLRKFPDVLERTTVLPTDEDWEKINEEAMKMDPTEKMSAFDTAIAFYVVDKIIELSFKHRGFLKNTFVILDTASQVYKKLMSDILEARETDERLKRMAQLAYSEPKRRFMQMIRYTAMWPTDVIWLGRTVQAGEVINIPNTDKTRWKPIPGKENPEWKGLLNYEATTIIYLTKKEEHLLDENRSFVLDETGQPKKSIVRYARIVKHKSGKNEIPTIRDPSPAKVMAWLRGL